MLQLTIEGLGGQWSDPINIDKPGTTTCDLEYKSQKVTIVIKVTFRANFKRLVHFKFHLF